MSEIDPSSQTQDAPGHYEIRFKGHLDDTGSNWFGNLTLTREDNGDTLLKGLVIDQAALHSLLKIVRELGLLLLSAIA